MGSLFITPALAFLSGSSTLNAFLDAVSSSTEYDSYLGETAPNLASVVHQFTILVGPNYARRYAFQQDLTRLREAGEKGVIISLANHLRQMERNAPLVSGAALALLQDEANLDEEGAVHFIRFPRVTPALPPNLLGPQHHDVEDMRNPGQELKTPIPHNLVLEDYREILQVKSPQEAVAVFTDFLEIPARRILALKYWYFSLDGDVDMRRTTAKALLKTVIEEGWGDFQEFAIRIVSNLLAEEYNIWMIFYLRELWHYLSEVDSQHLTPLQEKTV
ncbi:MAG: hypothetical protein U1D33_04755, partial [bacterium]|nr:hypothetical protein [bacterium]